jgi:hypothetical protein
VVEVEHRLDLADHALLGGLGHGFGVLLLAVEPLLEGPAGGQVAVQRVVGGGLVGDDVGLDAAL